MAGRVRSLEGVPAEVIASLSGHPLSAFDRHLKPIAQTVPRGLDPALNMADVGVGEAEQAQGLSAHRPLHQAEFAVAPKGDELQSDVAVAPRSGRAMRCLCDGRLAQLKEDAGGAPRRQVGELSLLSLRSQGRAASGVMISMTTPSLANIGFGTIQA